MRVLTAGYVGVRGLKLGSNNCIRHSKASALIALRYVPVGSSPVLLHVISCLANEMA